jgi:hypothetical protein
MRPLIAKRLTEFFAFFGYTVFSLGCGFHAVSRQCKPQFSERLDELRPWRRSPTLNENIGGTGAKLYLLQRSQH